jgi:hypothetical protein
MQLNHDAPSNLGRMVEMATYKPGRRKSIPSRAPSPEMAKAGPPGVVFQIPFMFDLSNGSTTSAGSMTKTRYLFDDGAGKFFQPKKISKTGSHNRLPHRLDSKYSKYHEVGLPFEQHSRTRNDSKSNVEIKSVGSALGFITKHGSGVDDLDVGFNDHLHDENDDSDLHIDVDDTSMNGMFTPSVVLLHVPSPTSLSFQRSTSPSKSPPGMSTRRSTASPSPKQKDMSVSPSAAGLPAHLISPGLKSSADFDVDALDDSEPLNLHSSRNGSHRANRPGNRPSKPNRSLARLSELNAKVMSSYTEPTSPLRISTALSNKSIPRSRSNSYSSFFNESESFLNIDEEPKVVSRISDVGTRPGVFPKYSFILTC